jgi:hypothetical protein
LEEPHVNDPGPAQLDLIRRYSRVMREMQADALRTRAPMPGTARSTGDRATRQAAKRFTKLHRGLPPTPAA